MDSIGEPAQPVTMTGKMDEKEGMTRSQRSQDDLGTPHNKYEVGAFAGLTSGLPAEIISNDFK